MKRRFTSTKTTGICRVCGGECHPRKGQRVAEHTEATHYEKSDISPKRMRVLRSEWIENNLQSRPKVRELLGRRATMIVKNQKTGAFIRKASGVFDFSGHTFTFTEDDGVEWEIDWDTGMNPIRLCAYLTFGP